MAEGRRPRGRVAAIAACIAMAGGLATAFAPTARAAPTFSAVNGTASGAALHLLAGSNAFPNFRTGAVDNRYPLAQARVDNSPTAEGTASPLDTGPLGQTAVATFNSGQAPTLPPPLPTPPPSPPPAGLQLSQPQYADAKFPPGSGDKPVTVGSPGGPYAAATAVQNKATAESELASVAGAAPSTASLSKLDAALSAWRLQFLTAADSRRLPAVHPDAAEPDGVDGIAGTASAVFDDSVGGLVVAGDARVAKASFGGGAIALFGIHTAAQIVNDGTPKESITTQIANATVGGVPVTVGPDGVSVNGTQVPGLGQAVQQASAALNAALAQGGYHVSLATPAITKGNNQETVTATGVRVTFQQPGEVGGIPQQFFDYSLGEVFADSLATPGTPPGATSAVLGTTETAPSAATSEFIPGTPGTPAVAGTSGGGLAASSTPAPAAAPTQTLGGIRRIASQKPTWLLLFYFMWQAALIGTAASLWWWRMEAKS